ncbi:MAG: hypothetical protein ACR2MP_29725 [Streptosporangiaceae bacterium]
MAALSGTAATATGAGPGAAAALEVDAEAGAATRASMATPDAAAATPAKVRRDFPAVPGIRRRVDVLAVTLHSIL